MVFRGAAKSTIYAVWKAYKLYKNRSNRSIIYAADDKLAGKMTRDVLNILRRHPLCVGMLPPKSGALSFWVNGSTDARNPSMEAVGINSNATGSRADDVDYDDVEVPKNIKKPESRQNLRVKSEEATHILVPGGVKTYVGTPHTHDSIYIEQIQGGAAVLKIPLFEHVVRFTDTSTRTRYPFNFPIGDDGLYVIMGIGKPAKMLVEGRDYRFEGKEVVFAKPPNATLDLCSFCSWPERFNRTEIELKRRETRTLNGWDSQYQLEAKPVTEVRLDPENIVPYDVRPVIRYANNSAAMILGGVQIVGAAAQWDPAGGKVHSDISSFSVTLQDGIGRRYLEAVEVLTGDIAEFAPDGKKIIGGQVSQICDLIERYGLTRIVIETNGIGGFAPAILKAAIKQRRLQCGVTEKHETSSKNQRILGTFEPLLSVKGQLWAHVDVLNGPFWEQMRDWNPAITTQPDDLLDSSAGAISLTPERIGKIGGNAPPDARQSWNPNAGVFDYAQ